MHNLIRHKSTRVNPQLISFAEDNPRGLNPSQITGHPDFEKLKTSIAEHGILEPLIIKPNPSGSGFILVDGERRLRAAKEVGKGKVPAIVVESEADGRVLAYQIHMLRVNWEKAAETKAIKAIIDDLKTSDPNISDEELRKQLTTVTAHKAHEIADLLKLALYDNETIDKVLKRDLNMSYLVQIEASFVAKLRKMYPGLVGEIGENRIRKCMVQKALRNQLGGTRFLMDKFRVVFQDEDPGHQQAIEKLLREFILKKRNIVSVIEDYRKISPENPSAATEAKETRTSARGGKSKRGKRQKSAASTGAGMFVSPLRVTRQLQTSIRDVRPKFEDLCKEFTEEEDSYIREALYCLEHNCFKAAALMMWSAMMSRVLFYASAHLSDFETASVAMWKTPKGVYRHMAKGFQTGFTDIDEVRERANDMQPLSYLVFRGLITTTEFKRLKADHATRCDCAHPTDIKLTANKIVDLFDNAHELIFANGRLK